ncbi:hypothetical protein [Helicobacter cappadocius]|uniref:Uncharacterized protein n=1 Tax=Helicobacter cappadocius TaxID=3063998 RepID=A0AA90PK65_9HELI|nr:MULTISPECIES: hypothetical protein [unclassified Helicobacter]MDO7253901.1 hypothetical protein [Helicobacter sp. faydin-H75]MDP2539762.1 hypothetical protein [Helicobacter sp. faydin-H76]
MVKFGINSKGGRMQELTKAIGEIMKSLEDKDINDVFERLK